MGEEQSESLDPQAIIEQEIRKNRASSVDDTGLDGRGPFKIPRSILIFPDCEPIDFSRKEHDQRQA
jgi:hypothetical protein